MNADRRHRTTVRQRRAKKPLGSAAANPETISRLLNVFFASTWSKLRDDGAFFCRHTWS